MKNEENLQHIAEQVKTVDNDITKILIPLLKDTIQDGNVHNKRLFILNMFLLSILLCIIAVSIILMYKQNIKYQEFLNQFDFETTVYQETDDYSTINSGINVTR